MNDNLNPVDPILIVDDMRSNIFFIENILRNAGMNNILTCNDSRNIIDIILKQQVAIALLDLNMPYVSGENMLSIMSTSFPEIPIIIVTSKTDIKSAVDCMKSGAFDYLTRPVNKGLLVAAVKRAIAFRELKKENIELKSHIKQTTMKHPKAFTEIVTKNQKMVSIFCYIESIAETAQPVLITGETGVGKELFAKTVHKLSCVKGKLVTVNAAGLDDNLFSDTLFGHVKGAFTGADQNRKGLIENALGGTLFLDEIGDLSQASQVKLLRLIQENEYLPLGADEPRRTNARIIAATNKDLAILQSKEEFREDLFYRIQTHHIHIPPLRDRIDDLSLLVDSFLESAANELNKKKPTVPVQLFTLLKTYHFPGNIRELKAMLFEAVSHHTSGILALNTLQTYIEQKTKRKMDAGHSTDEFDSCINLLKRVSVLPTIKQVTKLLVDEALRRSQKNQTIAANMLGLTQSALNKRLKRDQKDES